MSAMIMTSGRGNVKNKGALYRLGALIGRGITGLVSWLIDKTWRRLGTVIVLTGLAVGTAIILVPEAEYLPEGNRNFVFGVLLPPPGYNTGQLEDIADRLADRIRPYWEGQTRLCGGRKA